MNDYHEHTTQAGGLKLAGAHDVLEPNGDGSRDREAEAHVAAKRRREAALLLEAVPHQADVERRFAELRDPDGPTFVSPLGARRERAVPCSICRTETFALGGVCVNDLERELFVDLRDLALDVLLRRRTGVTP